MPRAAVVDPLHTTVADLVVGGETLTPSFAQLSVRWVVLPQVLGPRSLAAHDLDGDGDLDVVVSTSGDVRDDDEAGPSEETMTKHSKDDRAFRSPLQRTASWWGLFGVATALSLDAQAQVGDRYCDSTVNSTGQTAAMTAEGSLDVSENDLTLRCDGLPNASFGYFLVSTERASVPGAGGSSGRLCLGGAIGRYAGNVLQAGATGDVALALDLMSVPNPLGSFAVAANSTLNFQYWYRDAIAGGGATSNYSNGHSLTMRPGPSYSGAFFPTGGTVGAVVVADLDRDGRLDTLVKSGGTRVAFLANRANGLLDLPVFTETGTTGRYMAVEHIDFDGLLDLVILDASSQAVFVFPGNGDGTFGLAATTLLPDQAISLEVVDLDMDGANDVVVGGARGLGLLFNDGLGALAYHSTLPIPQSLFGGSEGLSVADLDGDGAQDLVATHRDRVATYLQSSPRTFDPPTYWLVGGDAPKDVEALDLFNDGDVDLVVVETQSMTHTLVVLEGDGTGNFTTTATTSLPAPPSAISAYDPDSDGDLDLLVRFRNVAVLTMVENLGAGSLGVPARIALQAYAVGVGLGDLDGDSRTDLVVGQFGRSEVGLVMGGPAGVPAGLGSFPLWTDVVGVAMLDGDASPEVVITTQDGHAIYSVVGPGSLALRGVVGLGAGGNGRLYDLDGDGLLDLVTSLFVPGDGSRITPHYGLGGGQFMAAPAILPSYHCTDYELGDVDLDGRDDIVSVADASSVAVNRSTAPRQFAVSVNYPCGLGASLLELADLDEDGDLDVVVMTGQLRFAVLFNQGDGTFAGLLLL